MKKVFAATYEGHQIVVENRWLAGEKLYVDGELQDENLGLSLRATLRGKCKSNQKTRHIKVTLGGTFTVQCKIFVDNMLVSADKVTKDDALYTNGLM